MKLIRYITDDLKYFADVRFHYLSNDRIDIKTLYDEFFVKLSLQCNNTFLTITYSVG